MMNRTTIVLISGAITNSMDLSKIQKLEGRPLILPVHGEVRPIRDREVTLVRAEIRRIFTYKETQRDACLNQFDQSLTSTLDNLSRKYIQNYIQRGDKENIIVLWNGSSDRDVLNRLNIGPYPILNIRCYDKLFNQNFFIQFEKLGTKEIIFELDIGTINKTGRSLNLEETHGAICSKKHKITHVIRMFTNLVFRLGRR